MKERLSRSTRLPASVQTPGYNPAEHGVGIVHLGIGAFHRAHQAVYTDDAIKARGGDWRIAAISLRNSAVADALNPQQGFYSILTRDSSGSQSRVKCRVIGSIDSVTALRNSAEDPLRDADYKRMMQLLTAANTKIVSLTVTEKAYGVDRQTMGIDISHPAISRDLAQPEKASGAIGILVRALGLRLKAGIEPFTVLCCDNLPANGDLLKSGTVDFARRVDPVLASHIESQVAFPNTMVDRITPAGTDEMLLETENTLGARDCAAVETEPFSQWVIEEHFPTGRPAWEAGGAQFVADVAPYEMMKLRMLNGAHSLIAYAGYSAGYRYVRDAMQSDEFVQVIRAHLIDASKTLPKLQQIDFADYATSLEQRFSNRAIAHQTWQIAMDGTEKLPQRILEPALHALQHNQSTRAFAFAIASWMYYCRGIDEQGATYTLRDPREAEIQRALQLQEDSASGIYTALSALPDLIPPQLTADKNWQQDVIEYLQSAMQGGMRAGISKRCGEL